MKTLLSVAAVVAALNMTAVAGASSSEPTRTTKHDRDVIRFFTHHPRLARTPAGVKVLWQVMSHLEQTIRSLQSARAAALAWPAHHNLWLCIHRGEGAWNDPNSGGNGHYGGLQMSPGWLGYFNGTANQYSQLQQERYAEQGYRDSGYSRSWLGGQWGQTIGPCWQYA